MSAPFRKKRVGKKGVSKKKEAESKGAVKKKASKPTGAPPFAVVQVRHGGRITLRQARGYSQGEVTQAGLNFGLARRWGLLVDDRRRSVLDGNVSSLRKWSPPTKETTEERVEGEVKKIERAVGKGVRKAEEEIEKVEREVVEKVEAPIKKRSKRKAVAKSKTS